MFKRLAASLALAVVVASAGCSSPTIRPDSLATGKRRVVELVLQAVKALPPSVQYQPPTEVGTTPCRRTLAGFVVGTTDAHRAEVPLIVKTPEGRPARALLSRIIAVWTDAGYRIDRSRLGEQRFPQVRAHAPAGYDVVATAFTTSPTIDLYSVSACLRGA